MIRYAQPSSTGSVGTIGSRPTVDLSAPYQQVTLSSKLDPNLPSKVPRDAKERLCALAPRLRHDGRFALLRVAADVLVQRDIAEERDSMLCAHVLHAVAGAEDVMVAATVRAREEGHVVDEAEEGHVDLLEHVDTLDGVLDGQGVRCCYYH